MAINIPNWEDVIILEDRSTWSPERQRQWRLEMARRIRASAVPEAARNVGAFLTYLDDIEDLISSAVFLGVAFLGLISRRHPLVRAAMVTGRALDAARAIAPIRALGAAVGCGPSQALRDDPYWSRWHVDRDAGIAELSRRIGPWLEVGQATETVFGVGLALGPIVGWFSDLVFSTPLGAPLEYLYETIEPLTSKALDVIRESPIGWLFGQQFTPEEHARIALGTALAWQIAAPWIARSPLPRTIHQLGDRQVPLRRPRHPATIAVLQEHGIDPTATPRWPLPASPPAISAITHGATIMDRARETQAELYSRYGTEDIGDLLIGTHALILRTALPALAGGPHLVRTSIHPMARGWEAIRTMTEFDAQAHTPDTLDRLWNALTATQEATGRTVPPRPDRLAILNPTTQR